MTISRAIFISESALYIKHTKGNWEMSIAFAVRDYLSEHGIKQSFVADKCGWSRQKMNCILNGKAKMTVDDFQEICKAVGAPYEVFLNTSQDATCSSA